MLIGVRKGTDEHFVDEMHRIHGLKDKTFETYF